MLTLHHDGSCQFKNTSHIMYSHMYVCIEFCSSGYCSWAFGFILEKNLGVFFGVQTRMPGSADQTGFFNNQNEKFLMVNFSLNSFKSFIIKYFYIYLLFLFYIYLFLLNIFIEKFLSRDMEKRPTPPTSRITIYGEVCIFLFLIILKGYY